MDPKHIERQKENPITLEALLSMKRSERPHAAFWERFDRQLKEKTMQSLWKQERPLYKRLLAVQWRALTPLRGALCLGSLLMVQLHCLMPSWTQSLLPCTNKAILSAAASDRGPWVADPMADALKQPNLLFVASSVPLGDSEVSEPSPTFSLGHDEGSWGLDAPIFHINPSLEAPHANKPIVFF